MAREIHRPDGTQSARNLRSDKLSLGQTPRTTEARAAVSPENDKLPILRTLFQPRAMVTVDAVAAQLSMPPEEVRQEVENLVNADAQAHVKSVQPRSVQGALEAKFDWLEGRREEYRTVYGELIDRYMDVETAITDTLQTGRTKEAGELMAEGDTLSRQAETVRTNPVFDALTRASNNVQGHLQHFPNKS
jgi:predicted ArsR family transcriptional regulator